MVGVWVCMPFTDGMMLCSLDAYMLFLEGELAMIMPDESEMHIHSGDAFLFTNCLIAAGNKMVLSTKFL